MHRFLFFIILSFFLIGCNGNLLSTTSLGLIELKEDKSMYEFVVGDPVPSDWTDYFDFTNPNSVKSYTINSDFSYKTIFDRVGDFDIQVRITLNDDSVVYETFEITVSSNSSVTTGSWTIPTDATLINSDPLNALVSALETTTYYSTETSSEVVFEFEDEITPFNIDSTIKILMDEENFSYIYYMDSDYTSTDLEFFEESFTSISIEGISIAMRSTYNEEWTSMNLSFEDYFLMDPGFYPIAQNGLLEGLDEVYSKSYGDYIDFYIPLSDENFSLSSTPDIYALLLSLGYISDEPANYEIALIEDHYSDINCVIVTDSSVSEILGIRYEYHDFLNQISSLMQPEIEVDFLSATLTHLSYSTEPFTLDYPEGFSGTPIDLLETGMSYFYLEDEINYTCIDTDNHQIYYSIKGDHYLYSFNYLTNESNQVYFDILPDHVFYRDDKVYVTLSDNHKYYWPLEQQYGGLAIVDALTFEKTNEWDLAFDPFSIVVDEDGFIYISSGSDQHSLLYSISPVSGQIISSRSGIYYSGELLYSDYTDRIYYFELMTTQDEITVFDVDRGVFVSAVSGEDGFREDYLTMSPDGRSIYTGNGIGFTLNQTLSSDGKTLFNVGFPFYYVGINQEDHEYYFSKDGLIVHTDSTYQTIDGIVYSGVSMNLFYDSGKLINVGDTFIEIMDLVNTGSNDLFYVTSAEYGSNFSPDLYIFNVIGSAEYDLISGSVNTSVLGQTELVYHLTEVQGIEVDETFTLIVNVVDSQEPMLSIPQDTQVEFEVNSEFVLPVCVAIDNLDGNVSCEVTYNDVDTSTIGTYTVVYESVDSSGNVGILIVNFEVTLPRVEVDLSITSFNGIIADAVFDVDSSSLFYIMYNTKEVVKYNLLTQVEERMSFTYRPETLTMYNGSLYVTIIHQDHSPYWWDDEQTGEIAIIDMTTFDLTSQFVIQVDPYSISVTEDYIYVFPGSGQWVRVFAISQADPSISTTVFGVRERTEIAYSTDGTYIFGITTDLSPQSLNRYQIDGTTIVSNINDPGHGDYSYGDIIFASPYEDYVFAENGKMFYQLQTSSHACLDFAKDMGFPISAMYFDTSDHSTYFGQENGYLYISYTADYKVSEEMYVGYRIDQVYEKDGIIYVVSFTSSDQVTVIEVERAE